VSTALPRAPGTIRRRKATADFSGGASPASQKTSSLSDKLPWPVALFLISLLIPWIIPLGMLSMPVYRMILLIMLLPCLTMWASGKAGPVRAADIGLLLYCLWAGLSLAIAHGVNASIQPGGVVVIETMGAYLLARCYIRDASSFRNAISFMAKLILLLLPFSMYEWITGSKPLLSIFGIVFPTVDATLMTPRMGFWRVQGPFEHSIAYGTFCGSMFALVALVAGHNLSSTRRILLTGAIGFAGVLSMSSAPIAGIMLQAALIAWNSLLKRYSIRWKVLWGLAFAGYVAVELGSNQTPVKFYISKFTFDHQTGWYRIWIWDYGSASVLNHPLFGIGLGDWARPAWMPADSVDNFWLLTAMRYGIPAIALFSASFLFIILAAARRTMADPELASYRTAYLISMFAFIIVGTTVHYWDAPYVWFLFLLGSGAWLSDVKSDERTYPSSSDRAKRSARRERRRNDNDAVPRFRRSDYRKRRDRLT
jgi:O-antigen ligase